MASLRIWLWSALFLAVSAQNDDDPLGDLLNDIATASLFSDIASVFTSALSAVLDTSTTTSRSSTSSRTSSTTSRSTTSSSRTSSTRSSSSTTTSSTSSSSLQTGIRTTSMSRDVNSQLITPSTRSSSTASVSGAAASAGSSATGSGSGTNKTAIIAGAVVGALLLIALILGLLWCCRRRQRKRGGAGTLRRSRSSSLSSNDVLKADAEKTAAAGTLIGSKHPQTTAHAVRPAPETTLSGETIHDASGPTNPFVPIVPPPRRSISNQDEAPIVSHKQPAAIDTTTSPGFHPLSANPPTPQSTHHGHAGSALAAGAAGGALGAAAMNHHGSRNSQDGMGSARNSNNFARDGQPSDFAIARKPVVARDSVNMNDPMSPVSPITSPLYPTTSPIYPATTTNDNAFIMNKSPRRRSSSRSRSRSWGRDTARANAVFDQHHSVHYPEHGLDYPAAGVGAVAGAGMMQQRRRSQSRSPHRNSWGHRSPAQNVMVAPPRENPAPYDVPPAPIVSNRNSDSPLGTGAPAAAAHSYINDGSDLSGGPVAAISRSSSNSSKRRSITPTRGNRKSRLDDDNPFDPEYHGDTVIDHHEAPTAVANSIIDNGRYPSMDPNRRSGEGGSRPNSFTGPPRPIGGGGRPGYAPAPVFLNQQNRQDSSAFRTNHGMPGGWRGTPAVSRESSSYGPWTPRSGQPYQQQHPQQYPQQHRQSHNGQQQLQPSLAELQRIEEQEMRARGRKSMESEWKGRDGYDGFDWHHGNVSHVSSNQSLGSAGNLGYGRAL